MMKKILLATVCCFSALVTLAQSGGNVYVLNPIAPSNGIRYSAPDGSGTYTVLANNTLYSIAKLHSMSVAELKDRNSLSSNSIVEGQQLSVNATTSIGRGLVFKDVPDHVYQEGEADVVIPTTMATSPATNTTVNRVKSTGSNTAVIGRGNTLRSEGKDIESLKGTHVDRGDSLWWYVAKDDDTYHTIATKYDMGFEDLKNVNEMSDYLLDPGMVLIVQPGKLYGMVEMPGDMPALAAEDTATTMAIDKSEIEGSVENTLKKELQAVEQNKTETTTEVTQTVETEVESAKVEATTIVEDKIEETTEAASDTKETLETEIEETSIEETDVEETVEETTEDLEDAVEEETEDLGIDW